MPRAIKGDHTIATPRPFESLAKPVTPTAEATALVKSRRTPSPTAKPASPTMSGRKTPSPTALARPGSRSPVNSQRMGPTSIKGTISPTVSRPRRPQHRSPELIDPGSNSPPPRPASPAITKFARSPKAVTLRCKSAQSHHEACGHPVLRARRGSFDQDDVDDRRTSHTPKQSSTVGTQTDPLHEHGIPFTSLVSDLVQASRPSPCEPSDNRFLENIAKIQGELAMAVCSGMELIAERGGHAPVGFDAGTSAAAGPSEAQATAERREQEAAEAERKTPGRGSAESGSSGGEGRSVGTQPACGTTPSEVEYAAYGSDSECDEVRSLSLSEEGPVYSKLCQWRMGAPDPIAMISEGQHTAIGDSDTDDELERSMGSTDPQGSDKSLAMTRIGVTMERMLLSKPGADSQEDALSELLYPILSKITNRLEVQSEQEQGSSAALRGFPGRPPTVQATKVPAIRSGESGAPSRYSSADEGPSLTLSHVTLSPHGRGPERWPVSARSDVSIGSRCSAFTSLSSPSSASGSLLSSPRARSRALTSSVSMPAGSLPSLSSHGRH